MTARKKPTLPRNFDALVAAGDLPALRAVFARCDVDARGGYAKGTALAFDLPDEVTRWLVT